jgi:hypothetical protein
VQEKDGVFDCEDGEEVEEEMEEVGGAEDETVEETVEEPEEGEEAPDDGAEAPEVTVPLDWVVGALVTVGEASQGGGVHRTESVGCPRQRPSGDSWTVLARVRVAVPAVPSQGVQGVHVDHSPQRQFCGHGAAVQAAVSCGRPAHWPPALSRSVLVRVRVRFPLRPQPVASQALHGDQSDH